MILCVAHRAYRSAGDALESPKGLAPFVGRLSVPIGGEPGGAGAGNPRGFSGSTSTVPHSKRSETGSYYFLSYNSS